MSMYANIISPETGLEVVELRGDPLFSKRPKHVRRAEDQMEGMYRIARAFVNNPEAILQELVNSAVELCGADSAGISLEMADGTDEQFYHWVATAGDYSAFLGAVLPRYPSACGMCLERGGPQRFRVSQPFFDLLGVAAPLVTDGIVLPWQVDEMRGTIFIMAHGRDEAFDVQDCQLMTVLADFAALGVRQQRQRERLMEQERIAAAAAMANRLAHKINNPLQGLTNILYLAADGYHGPEAREVGQLAMTDLQRLSALVKEILALPS